MLKNSGNFSSKSFEQDDAPANQPIAGEECFDGLAEDLKDGVDVPAAVLEMVNRYFPNAVEVDPTEQS